MIASLVTAVIVISAVVAVPTLSYVNLLSVDQQQLRNIALGTLKTMLFDTGYPTSWGSTLDFDPDQVERFGLALAGSPSFYVLDSDKVQRLVAGNPAGFIEYEDIRTKLKLQGYGFNLAIGPPFQVIVNDEDFDGQSNPVTLEDIMEGIEVLVASNDGSPIPKASVKATLVYAVKDFQNATYLVQASNTTDAVGRCTIKPKTASGGIEDIVIVFKVTVADLTTVTSSYVQGFGPQVVINSTIIGDEILLTIPEGVGWEKDSAGARWVVSLMQVSEDEVWIAYNGTKSEESKITWGLGHWGWSMLFPGLSYYNPLFTIFTLNVPNPRRFILVLGPEPIWRGLRVADCGGSPRSSPIVKVQRNVIISGMTYIAELTLWKESA